jgi:hypothetical protein
MLLRHLGRGMPQQGLHRAEGSPRGIEQTRCGVTQPVPIKALRPSLTAAGLNCRLSRFRRQSAVPVLRRRSAKFRFPASADPGSEPRSERVAQPAGSASSLGCQTALRRLPVERVTFLRSDRHHTSAEQASPQSVIPLGRSALQSNGTVPAAL